MPAANILPRATAMALGLLYSVAAFAQTSGTTTPGLSTTTPGFTLGPAPSFGSTTPSFSTPSPSFSTPSPSFGTTPSFGSTPGATIQPFGGVRTCPSGMTFC
jgi:hypothetical protein